MAEAGEDSAWLGVTYAASFSVTSYLGVPLMMDGHAIGTLSVADSRRREWTEADVHTLLDLVAVVIVGIEHRGAAKKNAEARAALGNANAQLLLAKNAAELANRAKAEFLTHMSHELRTPLNSIIGFTNILTKNTGKTLSAKDLKFVERIGFNGAHLLSLVDRILDLSRIEQGELRLRYSQVDVGKAVRAVCESLEGAASLANVSLTCEDVAPANIAPAPLQTDESKLHQIMMNLVGNALKFTPAGGSVRVSVVHDEVSGVPLRIEVSDTGIGIAEEAQARVFEAFEQAEEDTGARFGGTGLGLRISRALAEALGFALTLTSAPGEGSTFTVSFT